MTDKFNVRDSRLATVDIKKRKVISSISSDRTEFNQTLTPKSNNESRKAKMEHNTSLGAGIENKSFAEEKFEAEQKSQTQQPTKLAVQNVSTDKKLRYDAKATVPTWRVIGDPAADAAALEQFFNDLKRAKKLGFFDDDSQLIYMACNASNRSNLLDELPVNASTSLEIFITELRKAHGMTSMGLRQSVYNMRQKPGESPHSFFYRCINMYYRSRDKEPVPATTIQTSADHVADKGDLAYIFLNGLLDREVAFDLTSRGKTVIFSELPDHAKQVEVAKQHRSSNVTTMHIGSNGSQRIEEKLDQLVAAMSIEQPRRVKFEDHGRKQMKCFTCNKPGHFARDCRSARRDSRDYTHNGDGHSGRSATQQEGDHQRSEEDHLHSGEDHLLHGAAAPHETEDEL